MHLLDIYIDPDCSVGTVSLIFSQKSNEFLRHEQLRGVSRLCATQAGAAEVETGGKGAPTFTSRNLIAQKLKAPLRRLGWSRVREGRAWGLAL